MMERPVTTHRPTASAGFTLVELVVVLGILAVLAAIAVPAFSRDTAEADFHRVMRELTQDLRRAHYEAVSTREDRSIVIPNGGTSYQLTAVVPGTATMSALKQVQLPESVVIFAVTREAAAAGMSYSTPGAGTLPAEVRFRGTSDVQAVVGSIGAPTDSSATIFVETTDSKFRGRIVIYQTTSYVRTYEQSCAAGCTSW